MAKELAPHEKLEIHELLTLKTVCVTKSTAMLELADDEKLKEILKEDAQLSATAIEELKEILKEDQ
ncbi:spore coat protein [Bacillus sp. SA1-12]|uniref:spore coat protein n=1 Tax=Bacillus sp. SA1-12 TaxID=1455638 RepID=UPI000626B230|nr:spore coat protein [Bacillus sp. SA1-12]KKI92899.1 spore coat protein [Bacillus sp. SA1-12]